MRCNKCGAELKSDAAFCNICGTRVVRVEDMPTVSAFARPETKGGYHADAMPTTNSKPSMLPRIIAGVISVVLMLVGSIGLMADFGVSANRSENVSIRTPDETKPVEQTAWQKAYCDFIVNEGFRNSPRNSFAEETDILVYLYDIDHDGIPELVIKNGYAGRPVTRFSYISTYVNGTVRYIGFGPTDAYYDSSDKNSPLIGNVHRGTMENDHWIAYCKNGEEITAIDRDNDPEFFNDAAGYIKIYQERLADVQANQLSGLVKAYTQNETGTENGTETIISKSSDMNSAPITFKRILFAVMALLGLCGATVSMIVIIISKQAALTIITIIIYVTTSVGSVGGVTYQAVNNHVFDSVAASNIHAAVPSCTGLSVDEAKSKLEKSGYIVKKEYQFSDTAAKDTVISQTIEENSDSQIIIVILIISKGPEKQEDNAPGDQAGQTAEAAAERAPDGYTQKLTVTAEKGSSDATAVLYEWQDGKWKELASYQAAVGRNGIGRHTEGQHITPQGIYKLGVVLSKENDTTNLRTYRVTSSTCVVDDPNSRYYKSLP